MVFVQPEEGVRDEEIADLVAAEVKDEGAPVGVLAQARDIECIEVDLEVLRGERQPDLSLFAA